MSVVAREHVRSRPFARTVYVIAARRFTGDLILTQGSTACRVTWRDGKVIAAHSPSPADTPGRIALTAGLVTSTQLADALRRVAAPGKDQLQVLAETAQLTPAQVREIERKTMASRALRIFALEQASIVIDSEPTLPPAPSVPALDGRWLIYQGLRAHYTEERLAAEMTRAAGVRLRLSTTARAHLDEFGFSAADRRCLDQLAEGMGERGLTLDEMAKACPGMPRKAVMAIVYALLATDALAPAGPAARATVYTPAQGVATIPARNLAHTPAQGVATIPMRNPAHTPAQGVATIPARDPAYTPAQGVATIPARPAPPAPPPRSGRRTAPPRPAAADEIRALMKTKLEELDAGADYFRVIGVPREANETDIRTAYFELARKLHPDRLRAAGITDMAAESQRLFSQINQAFAVIGNPKKRARYMEALRTTGNKSGKGRQEDVESYAARILAAEEHFLRGEMALRRQQWPEAHAAFQKAVELNPDEAEHHALLGWATWCIATDKEAALPQVQSALSRALRIAPNNVHALFFRGRIASIRGEYQSALDHFRQVLKLNPSHQEAALEARLLQSRLDKGEDKGGLFTRRKRR